MKMRGCPYYHVGAFVPNTAGGVFPVSLPCLSRTSPAFTRMGTGYGYNDEPVLPARIPLTVDQQRDSALHTLGRGDRRQY